ncbi:MAG: solute carrier family 23 protein, partial [Pseudomonadota bacterium]
MNSSNPQSPVDEWLPLRWSLPLGFQQLLAAYASIIIAPLVLAAALDWPAEQTTYLVAAGLFGSGIATLIQCLGIGTVVGTRLPVVQGTTVAVIPPLLAIGANGDLTAMFGGTIVGGAVCLALAGYWSRLLRFFPPLVTGTVITVIGVSLLPVAVMWLSGGRGFGAQDTTVPEISLGLGTLLLVLLVMRFGSDCRRRCSKLAAQPFSESLKVTGVVGFEPTNDGTKTRCLTAWP